jgi:hypothetical protein
LYLKDRKSVNLNPQGQATEIFRASYFIQKYRLVSKEAEMNVVIKINNEKFRTVDLNDQGFKTKRVNGGVIVELPKKEKNIPARIPDDSSFLIFCTEKGDGDKGISQIVCGLSGKPLRPYYIPRTIFEEDHAFFSIPEALITVHGEKKNAYVTINEHRLSVQNGTAKVVSKVLWKGYGNTVLWKCECGKVLRDPEKHPGCRIIKKYKLSLPKWLDRFQNAAIAAREKALSENCREPHYYQN